MLAMLDMLQNVVLPSIPALIFFVLEVSPAPSHCCFNLLFHWTGTRPIPHTGTINSCMVHSTIGTPERGTPELQDYASNYYFVYFK